MSSPESIAILEQRPLRPGEALHVFRNGLHWVVSQESLLDDSELSWLDAVATSLAGYCEAAGIVRSTSTTDSLPLLPIELATLLQRFGHLAEADDERREQLKEGMDAATIEAFLAFVTPLFSLINDYLDSLSAPWPEVASQISSLGEFASELGVDQRERS